MKNKGWRIRRISPGKNIGGAVHQALRQHPGYLPLVSPTFCVERAPEVSEFAAVKKRCAIHERHAFPSLRCAELRKSPGETMMFELPFNEEPELARWFA